MYIQRENKFINYKYSVVVMLLALPFQVLGQYQLSFESYNFSESFYIQDLIDDNPSSVRDGRVIYSQSRFTAGYEFPINEIAGFSLAYLYRRDALLIHSQGAADIYYLTANESEAADESFKADLDITTFDAEGISVSYRLNLGLDTGAFHVDHLGITLDIAKTNHLFYATLRSNVDYKNKEISGNADLDYYYYTDPIYDRDVSPTQGLFYGVSADFSIETSTTRHEVDIRDIYNLSVWKDAPHTKSQLNTQRIAGTREDGTLEIMPLGSGKESYKSLYLKLAPRVFTSHMLFIKGHPNYQFELNRLFERTQIKVGALFPLLSESLFEGSTLRKGIGFKYSPTDDSGELTLIYDVAEIALAIDSINFSRAQSLELQLLVKF